MRRELITIYHDIELVWFTYDELRKGLVLRLEILRYNENDMYENVFTSNDRAKNAPFIAYRPIFFKQIILIIGLRLASIHFP